MLADDGLRGDRRRLDSRRTEASGPDEQMSAMFDKMQLELVRLYVYASQCSVGTDRCPTPPVDGLGRVRSFTHSAVPASLCSHYAPSAVRRKEPGSYATPRYSMPRFSSKLTPLHCYTPAHRNTLPATSLLLLLRALPKTRWPAIEPPSAHSRVSVSLETDGVLEVVVRVKSEENVDGWARWTNMCASTAVWKCGHMPKLQGASKVLKNPQQAYVEFYPNHRTGQII
ncbi:hypothetical protein CBL_07448 [Carabus blaptoides fortunei]